MTGSLMLARSRALGLALGLAGFAASTVHAASEPACAAGKSGNQHKNGTKKPSRTGTPPSLTLTGPAKSKTEKAPKTPVFFKIDAKGVTTSRDARVVVRASSESEANDAVKALAGHAFDPRNVKLLNLTLDGTTRYHGKRILGPRMTYFDDEAISSDKILREVSGKPGSFVLILGHVERGANNKKEFVVRDAGNEERARVSFAAITAQAKRSRVSTIFLGCEAVDCRRTGATAVSGTPGLLNTLDVINQIGSSVHNSTNYAQFLSRLGGPRFTVVFEVRDLRAAQKQRAEHEQSHAQTMLELYRSGNLASGAAAVLFVLVELVSDAEPDPLTSSDSIPEKPKVVEPKPTDPIPEKPKVLEPKPPGSIAWWIPRLLIVITAVLMLSRFVVRRS